MNQERESPRPNLPSWVSEKELYKFQVRQATQYAMFAFDPDGILLTWNEGIQSILGYSEEEWLGKHACIIFTPPQHAQEVCAAGWHVRKDGSQLFAHGFINVIRGEDGSLLGYSKILSDETTQQAASGFTD
jgi:PAS domain S-box-containing protein